MRRLTTAAARALLFRALATARGGTLEVAYPGGVARFGAAEGGLEARLVVHDERFFVRALTGGDAGIGEAYVDGDWSTPDLVALVRLAVRNLDALDGRNRLFSAVAWAAGALRHRLRANTVRGSRRNIHAHYDLGNDFFRLFLDPATLAYSCARYLTPDDTLEQAQVQKLEAIGRKLDLGPGDRVLEIGTGWGGFAVHAASRWGCHVTTTTISAEQHAYAADWIARAGVADRVELLFDDYRDLTGRYDAIVSIEMFEAVGLRFYDDFFGACDRLLAPDGAMLLQTITMNDQTYPAYRRRTDWIQQRVFPGSELASLAEIARSLGRATRLTLHHAENIGAHYARTLHEWRTRFHANADEVARLGYGERFIRTWDYYLAYCEGAFLERHIGDYQLLLAKTYARRPLLGEPWRARRAAGDGLREDAKAAVGTDGTKAATRHSRPTD
jgi:cyclopropane-fatty-acyl-phospholipid synthase